MPQRRFAALVLAAVALLAACGSSDDSDAVEIAAAAPGQAADAACTLDRQTLETAVAAYEALTGSVPTNQQELVEAQVIRELSPHFEVGADGAVTSTSGSPCP